MNYKLSFPTKTIAAVALSFSSILLASQPTYAALNVDWIDAFSPSAANNIPTDIITDPISGAVLTSTYNPFGLNDPAIAGPDSTIYGHASSTGVQPVVFGPPANPLINNEVHKFSSAANGKFYAMHTLTNITAGNVTTSIWGTAGVINLPIQPVAGGGSPIGFQQGTTALSIFDTGGNYTNSVIFYPTTPCANNFSCPDFTPVETFVNPVNNNPVIVTDISVPNGTPTAIEINPNGSPADSTIITTAASGTGTFGTLLVAEYDHTTAQLVNFYTITGISPRASVIGGATGDVYVAGAVSGLNPVGTFATPPVSARSVILRLDSSLTPSGVNYITSASSAQFSDLSIDPTNNVIAVAGEYGAQSDLNPLAPVPYTLAYTNPNPGLRTGFVVVYNAGLQPIFSKIYNGPTAIGTGGLFGGPVGPYFVPVGRIHVSINACYEMLVHVLHTFPGAPTTSTLDLLDVTAVSIGTPIVRNISASPELVENIKTSTISNAFYVAGVNPSFVPGTVGQVTNAAWLAKVSSTTCP